MPGSSFSFSSFPALWPFPLFLFFLALFLDFFDALLRLLVFLFLFAFAQVLAVLLHQRRNLFAVEIEKGEFLGFFLGHLAGLSYSVSSSRRVPA